MLEKKNTFLGRNKEILDVELRAILEVLNITSKETQNMTHTLVTIFCDFQKALRVIEYPLLQKRNRFLRDSIYKKIKKLESNKHYITIWWISSLSSLVGNKRANKMAKNRVEREEQRTEWWSLLVYIYKNLIQVQY